MKRKILTRSAGMTKKQVIALAIDARSNPAQVAKTLQGRDRQVKPKSEPTIAHHLTLKIGSLVEVYAPDREDVNGRLGRIESVGEKTARVWMRQIPTLTMNLHSFTLSTYRRAARKSTGNSGTLRSHRPTSPTRKSRSV
jgi:hypothetical protein